MRDILIAHTLTRRTQTIDRPIDKQNTQFSPISVWSCNQPRNKPFGFVYRTFTLQINNRSKNWNQIERSIDMHSINVKLVYLEFLFRCSILWLPIRSSLLFLYQIKRKRHSRLYTLIETLHKLAKIKYISSLLHTHGHTKAKIIAGE